MAISAEELLAQVHNLYAALNEKRSFSRYREHVQKLGVAAGDHCLYTDKVEPGRRVSVTSVCSLAECADVDLVTLARGFMHNIFEVGRYLTPGEDETTCAEGLWILGPGEYLQACFEGVPAGCDLHLFASGTNVQALNLLFGMPLLVTALEEEVVAAGFLWHCDEGGAGTIYKLNIDGSEVLSFASPGTFPNGLAWDGTNLWVCDRDTDRIYKLDPSDGTVLDSFATPTSYPGGLTWDGTYLRYCDDVSPRIYRIDPSDGSVIDYFTGPGDTNTGLAFDGTYLWLCCMYDHLIFKLNASTGAEIDSFATPGSFPTGLAWDGEYLWHCDRGTDLIYKIDISVPGVIDSFDSPGSFPEGLTWQA